MNELSLSTIDLTALVTYMMVVVAIGLVFSRQEKSSEDFLLGGRKVAWWAVGISTMMSVVSTVSMVAVPGEVYNNGLSMLMFSVLYPVTSLIAFFLFIRFYFKLRSFTPFDYLERRFGPGVRLALSLLYIFKVIVYVALVLYASATIFEGAAGWDIPTTIVVIAVIGIFYTMLGGIRAVIWTDVIQFFTMFGGILVAVWICVRACDGGLPEVLDYAFDHGRGPERFADPDFYTLNPYVRLSFWLLLTFALLEPVFYNSADQITVQRLLSTSSYKSAKKATITNSLVILPITFIPWLIGLAIFTYYHQNPDPRITSGDQAFFLFVSTKMPAPLPGLILASMLAAAMSTLDSAMNSLSAVLVKDFYLRKARPDASESRQVWVARVLTVAIGVLGAGLAIVVSVTSSNLRESVIEIGAIWGSFAIVLGPVFLLGVTSRKVTGRVIWFGITACWGATLGMVAWYSVSKSGHTGPIAAAWWLLPAAAATLLFALGRFGPAGPPHLRFAAACLGTTALGFAIATGFWYLMARHTGGELSFLWLSFPGLVLIFLIGYGSIPFLKHAPPSHHTGLTLWSSRHDVQTRT
jgi:SSS family transporter